MHNLLRKGIINVVLVIVTIAVTLVVAEIGFRLFRPQRHFAVTVNTWDRVTGTRHIPNAKGFVVTTVYEMDLIINSKGLRDREFAYAKPENTKRVLCLGGSFTCGYGVQAKETFAKVLEHLLNSDGDESVGWEVLNAGVGSTGTAHQLAYFKTEGYKYDPDYVLLCFSQQTDYWDNIKSGLYTLEGDRLIKHDAPHTRARRIQKYTNWIPGYNSLFARSHLLNFVKKRIAKHHYRDLARRIVLPDGESSVEEVEEELTRALLMALRDACADIDCRLVMTAIPYPDTWTWYDETVALLAFTQAQGIPFIDLVPAFSREADRGVQIDYPGDRHWTVDGHRLAGQVLYDFFAGQPTTN